MKTFKTFLNKQIKYLDGLEANWAQLDAPWETTEYMIQETADHAAKLGLAELYKKSLNLKGTFSDCKFYLAECLATIKTESESLTPPQVAKILGVNPDKILTWIRNGELQAVNVTKRQGGRAKYRITKENLEAFKLRRTPQRKVKKVQQRTTGKQYY